MGFPQVSSTDDTDEDRAVLLGSFLQSPSQFSGVSTCNSDGLHGETISQTVGEALSSSLGDFQRKAALECSNFPEDSMRFGGATDSTLNVNGTITSSADKIGKITPKSGRSIQDPASRIIGFESRGASSLNNGIEGLSADHLNSSSVAGLTVNEVDLGGPLVRKRLLSPLSSMLSAEHFHGDNLNIGCCASQMSSSALIINLNVSASHDHKKANVGSKISFTSSSSSLSSCLEKRNMLYDNNTTASIFLTDGPLLENKDPLSNSSLLYSPILDRFRVSSEGRSQNGTISLSPKKAISPHVSLSPLSPKFSERVKTPGGSKDVKNCIEDCCSNLKNIEQSLAPEEADFRITSKSFEDIDLFHKDFRSSSLESATDSWCVFQESAPSQCARFVRSLSGLPVRRSLVGSFEESLLSGRFCCGKFTQVSSTVMFHLFCCLVLV